MVAKKLVLVYFVNFGCWKGKLRCKLGAKLWLGLSSIYFGYFPLKMARWVPMDFLVTHVSASILRFAKFGIIFYEIFANLSKEEMQKQA